MNDNKEVICRAKCTESGDKLINERCLNENEAKSWQCESISLGQNNLDYCTQISVCFESCINGCDESGKCLCSDTCENGCDESGKCSCPVNCTTSCDINGHCQCNSQCSELCRSNGECFCEIGEAVCTSQTEIKECFDHKWVTRNCSAGCQKGSDDNHDACIPFVCNENELKCDENKENVQICRSNAWAEGEKCDYGCDKGLCLLSEDIVVSTDNVRLLKGKFETSEPVVVKYFFNKELKAAEFSIQHSDINCVTVSKQVMDDDTTQLTISINPEVEKCETTLTLKTGNAEKSIVVHVFNDEDNNGNHMFDYYETASKQGEDCLKYSDCDSSDGKELGFCDSFIGYQCSTKCTADEQCVNSAGSKYHYVCRADGRCAPDALEIVVKVEDGESINFVKNRIEVCDFTVDWGEGEPVKVSDCSKLNEIGHTFLEEVTDNLRTIKLKGVIDGIKFSEKGYNGLFFDPLSAKDCPVISIHSFGPAGLNVKAFEGSVIKFNELVDIPDATKLKGMTYMFANSSFNNPIENWDVSNVESMKFMFYHNSGFNQPLGRWDTSNVTDMNGMFQNASAFNQDIGDWDTSNVQALMYMFQNASSFNQDISGWNVENVFTINSMH